MIDVGRFLADPNVGIKAKDQVRKVLNQEPFPVTDKEIGDRYRMAQAQILHLTEPELTARAA
jgi:hypothetical protein